MSVTEHSWNFDSFQSDAYLWTQREILQLYHCTVVPVLNKLFQLQPKMWFILLYSKYLLHAHFWVVSDYSLQNYFYILCIRLCTCPEDIFKVKTFFKWHVLHFVSVLEIRREKDASRCWGEATELIPGRQQGFPLDQPGWERVKNW